MPVLGQIIEKVGDGLDYEQESGSKHLSNNVYRASTVALVPARAIGGRMHLTSKDLKEKRWSFVQEWMPEFLYADIQ